MELRFSCLGILYKRSFHPRTFHSIEKNQMDRLKLIQCIQGIRLGSAGCQRCCRSLSTNGEKGESRNSSTPTWCSIGYHLTGFHTESTQVSLSSLNKSQRISVGEVFIRVSHTTITQERTVGRPGPESRNNGGTISFAIGKVFFVELYQRDLDVRKESNTGDIRDWLEVGLGYLPLDWLSIRFGKRINLVEQLLIVTLFAADGMPARCIHHLAIRE
mmetsp:Transcript_47607/g.53264  ORF Transcript_47607/g.53264 Transcript_47607/m.53264 type:complete len:216 (-) Transcript_47607:295-942(-)